MIKIEAQAQVVKELCILSCGNAERTLHLFASEFLCVKQQVLNIVNKKLCPNRFGTMTEQPIIGKDSLITCFRFTEIALCLPFCT